MFTGLIETTGRVDRVEPREAGRRIRLLTPLAAELTPGDSIAVNGVCLTVTTADATGFDVDVSPETLRVTTMGEMTAGRIVNLERPLAIGARLGGHFVLGHVDGVGRIASIRDEHEYHWIEIEFPATLAAAFISKGSIAVDGISLTVARLEARRFGVQIVPFTWTHTALHSVSAGDHVNLEGDMIGKYVARLHALGAPTIDRRSGKDS
jgi:riboflavin synthase